MVDIRRLQRAIGLTFFVVGMIAAALIFTEVQILNGVYHISNLTLRFQGYPWWTERITLQSCFVNPGPNDNCGFVNYAQGLVISLVLSFLGFFDWQSSQGISAGREARLRALGLSLLLFGLLIASVVFWQVQILNSQYHIGSMTLSFEGFPYGGQEVLGSACVFGTNPYECVFFNYDQLLYLSALAALGGFLLWEYLKPSDS
jgi:hypothetical protein